MTETPGRPRAPWRGELARLRWLEHRLVGMVGEWQTQARELRVTRDRAPAADREARRRLEARAHELDGAAEALAATLTASHAGPVQAGDLNWAAWHVDELARHLAAAQAAVKDGRVPADTGSGTPPGGI
jgi:aminoglycoside phosphotransferase